jgi:hypothetical protein
MIKELQMLIRFSVCIFAAAFFLLQGCVAVQTYPTVARAGDTITLALGSVEGLDKSKMTLAFVPQSTGVPVYITSNIRNVVRIYPDRTSFVSLGNTNSISLTGYSGHAMWMNIAVVDLPSTLPVGKGYFQVTFTSDVRVPNFVQNAPGIQIATEILPGSGTASTFSYWGLNGALFPLSSQLSLLKPLPGVVLGMDLDPSELHVIWEYKPTEDNKQIALSWHYDGSGVITVNMLAPIAMSINEKQIRFTIVVDPSYAGNLIQANGTPVLLSQRLFDANGNSITAQYPPEVVVLN